MLLVVTKQEHVNVLTSWRDGSLFTSTILREVASCGGLCGKFNSVMSIVVLRVSFMSNFGGQ